MNEKLLSVQNLHTSFFTDAGEVQAVNGVNFDLDRGEIQRLRQIRHRLFHHADSGRYRQDRRRQDPV